MNEEVFRSMVWFGLVCCLVRESEGKTTAKNGHKKTHVMLADLLNSLAFSLYSLP